MAGCGSGGGKSKIDDEPKRPKPTGKIETATTNAGSATRYSDRGPRRALWSIDWGQAQLDYDDKGRIGGEMDKVGGRLYKGGQPASKFKADGAKAEFGTENLALAGGVRLTFDDPPAVIDCETVIWNPELERIEARGKVMLEAEKMRFGPFDVIYASPDLKEISTPDLFRKTK